MYMKIEKSLIVQTEGHSAVMRRSFQIANSADEFPTGF